MWYLSIRISHCLVVRPVNENIPIWFVMWSHVPGAPIRYSYARNRVLILIILLATSSLSSFCHSAKLSLLFKILATIRAPCIGGLEYIFLAMILRLCMKLLDLRKDLFSGILV